MNDTKFKDLMTFPTNYCSQDFEKKINSGRIQHVSAAILAGGKALRMGGVNKALLTINGKSIIEWEIAVLDEIFSETIIITNTPEKYEFLGKPLFRDIVPDKGSLGGIYTGLVRSENQYCFFVPCDMPFLNKKIINVLLANLEGHDVVIPKINGYLEPMHAIYSKKCLPFIELLLASNDLKIKHLFDEVDTYEVPESCIRKFDPDFDFIMNVNTPDDLEAANRKMAVEYKSQAKASTVFIVGD